MPGYKQDQIYIWKRICIKCVSKNKMYFFKRTEVLDKSFSSLLPVIVFLIDFSNSVTM